MAVNTFTKTGTKATSSVTLPKNVFAEEMKNSDLLHQVFVAQHAEKRAMGAHVLERGEVRGGGRKPWRQKGTGRARHGSIRSPIWSGGGVTFGPSSERNYSKKLNVQSKRKALRQALTLSAKEGHLSIIEAIESKDGKTKPVAELITKLGLKTPLMVVVDNKTAELDRATRNIDGVSLVKARYLNVFRMLNSASILMTKAAIEEVDVWLGKKDK